MMKVSYRLVYSIYFFTLSIALGILLYLHIFRSRVFFPSNKVSELATVLKGLEVDKRHSSQVFSDSYRISLSLLVPPGYSTLHWEISAAVLAYLNPFLRLLENAIDVEVDTEVLYFTTVFEHVDSDNVFNIKTLENIHGIDDWSSNSITKNSHQSNFHFYLLLPPFGNCSKTFYVRDKNGSVSKLHNFFIPNFGGVVFHEHCSLKKEAMKSPLEYFTNMFLKLLNIPFNESKYFNKTDDERFSIKVASFEKHFMKLYILKAAQTLQALNNLIIKMSHMSIPKHVSSLVDSTLDTLLKTIGFLRYNSPEGTHELLEEAKKAFLASEKAFFDYELLPQLYFPVDQMLAVLAPLLFPIILPIILNLAKEVQLQRGKTHKINLVSSAK